MFENYLHSINALTGDLTWTIVLGTLSVRSALITPIQIIVRHRINRYEMIKPMIESWNSIKDKNQLSLRRRELFQKYNCSALGTIGRSLIQLPIFLTMSWSIKNILESSDTSKPFLWLDSLSQVDSSLILPITLCGIHLLNLQNYNYFEIKQSIAPFKFLGSILAFSMIPISSFVPTGIILYWITSSAHSLISNIFLSVFIPKN